jgi:hypothetical protein
MVRHALGEREILECDRHAVQKAQRLHAHDRLLGYARRLHRGLVRRRANRVEPRN